MHYLGKNSITSVIGALIPVLAVILTMPPYLRAIGPANFGFVSLIWVVVGFFALFEAGLGLAVSQMVLDQSPARRKTEHVLGTALAVAAGLGLAGAVVMLPAFFLYLHFNPAFRAILFSPVMLSTAMALALLLGILNSVLLAALRLHADQTRQNLEQGLSAALQAIAAYAAATQWPERVDAIILAAVLVRASYSSRLIFQINGTVVGLLQVRFEREAAAVLARYLSWTSLSSLIGPLMGSADRFMLGALAGPAALGVYSLATQLFEKLSLFPNALITPYFLEYTRANPEDRAGLQRMAWRKYGYLVLAFAVSLVFASPIILRVWIGGNFAEQAVVPSQIVCVGFLANVLARIAFAHLHAEGRPDMVAKAHLLELPLYAAILVPLTLYFGAAGAASASAMRCLLDLFLLARASGDLKTHRRVFAVLASVMAPAVAVGILIYAL